MSYLAENTDESAVIQEALDNFAVLLDDYDFSGFLEPMHIGRFQFLRRKQMLQELGGLFIALWRLALARSFPRVADRMLDEFLYRYALRHPGKQGENIVLRAREYWSMVEPCGDSDFIVVARHLASFLVKEEQDTRALTLRLALALRNAYGFIFCRLI